MMERMDSLVPQKYKVLSGSALKLIAVISMLIDHTAFVLLGEDAPVLCQMGSHRLTLYDTMRFIGRIAFPIYCFLLVEGFLHTRDPKKYGGRLFLFALISEIPWNLEHTGHIFYAQQNVFFTLFLGFLGLCLLRVFQEKKDRKVPCALGLFALLVASIYLRADYDISGYCFILMLYLLREQPPLRAVVGSVMLPNTWRAGLAFLPISLYNGKRGFVRSQIASLCFYALYPVHILLLYWIRLNTIGYENALA